MGFALVALMCLPFACANEVQATPVEKVIELMQGMLAKGKEEKQAELVQFAEYKMFCENTRADKEKAIAEANEQIDLLKADIEKYATDAEALGQEVAALGEDIAVWNGDMEAALKVRAIEKADFDKMHLDYSQSVDALTMAIQVLKEQAYDRPQAEALVQLSSLKRLQRLPAKAKATIEAFLQEAQEQPTGLAVSAPEAHGYDF